jgi:hypothetical protein
VVLELSWFSASYGQVIHVGWFEMGFKCNLRGVKANKIASRLHQSGLNLGQETETLWARHTFEYSLD